GYVHHRLRGAAAVGAAFGAPAFLMVVGLGWAYVHFGGVPWIRPGFYGVGSCEVGIIPASAFHSTRPSGGRDPPPLEAGAEPARTTILTASEVVPLVLVAGVVVWLVKAPPSHPWARRRTRRKSQDSPWIVGRTDRLVGLAPFPLASIIVSTGATWGTLWVL